MNTNGMVKETGSVAMTTKSKNRRAHRRENKKDMIYQFIITALLCVIALVAIVPLLSVLALSFSSKNAVNMNAVSLVPVEFTLASWKAIFARSDMWRATGITVASTVIGTVMALLITSMMAYPLSKKEFKLSHILMVCVIITMIFKAPIVPYFLTLRSIGLYNNPLVLVLPHILSAYNLAVMRTFFMQFSKEIEESAMIDGCGPFRVLFRIVLPSSKAIIATIGLFYGVVFWNQYQHPLYFIQDTKLYPLQMKVRQFMNAGSELQDLTMKANVNYTDRSLKAAIVVFAIMPIIAIYHFIQKYFAKGAMLGSVKG